MSHPADSGQRTMDLLLGHLLRDLRHGLRMLRRSPVFTAVGILSLALGVGANAAVFQLIDAVRFRSLPIANAHELAEVRTDWARDFGVSDDPNSEITYPLWEQIRTNQTAFASMFAWGNLRFLVGRGSEVRGARGLLVSGDFFSTLGITAERGRVLTADDDRRGCGAGPAVVSHGFWQTFFGGRESAIGSALTLLGQPFTVVGVMPVRFTGLEVGQTFDVAVPLCAAARFGDRFERKDYFWLTVMGRLKPDWPIVRANEQLRTLSPGLLQATVPSGYGEDILARYRTFKLGVLPASRGISQLRESYGTPLWLLFGLTGLVLLITCGNLATLLLARASVREREIAVRAAIGASRARLVSQMLIESLLVAVAGAALAVPVALLSARALAGWNSVNLDLVADWRLLSFVGAIAFLMSMLFGLIPALRVSIVDPSAAMRLGSRGSTIDRHRARFQRALMIGQIAVSLVLIVSAFAFVQSFRNLMLVDTGFDLDGALAVSFEDVLPTELPVEQRIATQQRLTSEIRSVPGVVGAAATTHTPLDWSTWAHFFRLTNDPEAGQKASRFMYVSPGYLNTLKIPIRGGRDFDDLDTARSRRVMLVNESFVHSHLDGRQPIGATLRTIAEPGYPETTYEIIGVVGDTKYSDLRDENCWCDRSSGSMPPIAYVPIAQNPDLPSWPNVIVRSSAPLSGISAAITQRVANVNPAMTVQFTALTSILRQRLLTERMMAWLAGAFGVLATILVIVGLYGVIAYITDSRRNEIGIRLSFGSTRAQIVRLVLRDGAALLAAGLLIGLPLTAAAMRSASTMLFGLSPTDLLTIAGATGLLAAAVGVACCLPAWRAARVEPSVALRSE
jgi:putative ABC transport system permease protein